MLELDASDAGIVDLTGLEFATALQTLNLSGNAVSDVGPLQQLTDLTWLDLAGNSISDVAPLSQLTMLGFLGLEGNPVTDIEPLVGLTDLRELTLDGNPLNEESITVHLPALEMAGVAVAWTEVAARRNLVLLFPGAGDVSGRQGNGDTHFSIQAAASAPCWRQEAF